MEKPTRTLAFMAYLLPLIGPLFILLFNRKNLFAIYHAYQSLAIVLAAIVLSLAWVVVSWAITWIPLVGPVLAISFFALVMATWLFVLIALITGMVNAAQARYRRVPIFGQWGESAFLRFHADEEIIVPQEGQEAVI